MSRRDLNQFDRLISDNYAQLKPQVLAAVHGKFRATPDQTLHLDASDLDELYNAAWHALHELLEDQPDAVSNIRGWLATFTYRRAIEEIRSPRMRCAGASTDEIAEALSYEPDIDQHLDDRRKCRQWLVSVRLQLTAVEQQAVGLCVLREYSRREAAEAMGVELHRLDKIMKRAKKKLGDSLEAISRGDWCDDQQSLVKAYALGLHAPGGERHTLALEHISECQACAAYVRSLRDVSVVVPAPVLLGGAMGAGGGVLTWIGSLFSSGSSGGAAAGSAGTAAGGGAATLVGGMGAKTATLCVTAMCAAGGALVVVEREPARDPKPSPSTRAQAPLNRPTSPNTAGLTAAPKRATSTRSRPRRASSRPSTKRTAPDPRSQGAQELAELGIEPQATSTRVTSSQSVPTPADATEFGIEGP